MNREEAIKYAKENILAYTSEMAEFQAMAIEALEQTRWIPVSERLPENYKDVLVQWQRISRFDNTIEVFLHTGIINEYGEWIHADRLGVFNGEVIAWMPLPKPYEEGEQE